MTDAAPRFHPGPPSRALLDIIVAPARAAAEVQAAEKQAAVAAAAETAARLKQMADSAAATAKLLADTRATEMVAASGLSADDWAQLDEYFMTALTTIPRRHNGTITLDVEDIFVRAGVEPGRWHYDDAVSLFIARYRGTWLRVSEIPKATPGLVLVWFAENVSSEIDPWLPPRMGLHNLS